MEYNVTAIPKDEFLHYRELVLRSMASRRTDVKATKLVINRVTEDYAEFDPLKPEKFRRKILRSSIVGQAWPAFRRIWIKPGRGIEETRITAIHEISHLGELSCAHAPKWRRVFGVALAYHAREQGRDEASVKQAIADLAVYRYRKYREWTPQGQWNSYAEYLRKCDAEVDSIYRASLKG